MNRKNIILIILFFCFSTIHYAISQYVWDNLNDRTKQIFEKAGAKNNLLLASNSSKKWLHPDNQTRRQADSKRFGGGHGTVKSNIKAANYYLNLAEKHFIKGTSTDIQKSAYYIGYALDFLGDSLTPAVSGVSCDKSIRACSKRYMNTNIPFNKSNKDVIKNNKYISFGRPHTHTLTEMGLTKTAFLNKNKEYQDIVGLVKKAEKVNQVGSKVLSDKANIQVLADEYKQWQDLIKNNQDKPESWMLSKEKELQQKHAAYALKAVIEYFKGTDVYGIWFSDLKAYEDLPLAPNLNASENVILPKKVGVETLKPPLETDPTVNWGNNVLIMDDEDKVLSWLDVNDLDIEEKNVLGGFKTLSLSTKMTDTDRDAKLFKQGNKIFINGDSDNERCLYVFNTELNENFTDSTISINADEVLSELNNVPPFYIYDPKWEEYRVGNNVLISTDFLKELLKEYYIIDDHTAIDLYDIDPAKRRISITGTIKILDLLREVESLTGCYFKRHYEAVGNKVEAKIELLKPKRYGKLHTAPVEAIKLGRNTNKLEYTTNEENNAVGVAPIMTKDNEDDSKDTEYAQMVKDWMKITANTNNYGTDTDYAPEDFDTSIDYSAENWGNGLYENGESGAKIVRDVKEYEFMPYTLVKQIDDFIPIAELKDGDSLESYQIINPMYYLGKTYPKLIVCKSPGSSEVSITIRSMSIVEDEEIIQHITFKDNVLWDSSNHSRKTGIPPNSPIIIDCNKQTIQFTRSYWANTEVSTTKTVTETTKSKKKVAGTTAPQKGGVYCTCGKYAWGKKYTTVFVNKCPFCGAKLKWHQSYSNSGAPTKGSANRELRCKSCGADFCFDYDTRIIVKDNEGMISYKKLGVLCNSPNFTDYETLSVDVNTQKVEWKQIINTIIKPPEMLYKMILNNGEEVISTLNHEYYSPNFVLKKMNDLTKRIKTVNYYNSKKYELNPSWQLYGFFLGDGTINSNYRIIFNLKKEDKVSYLKQILDSSGLKYSFSDKDKYGYYRFRLTNKDNQFIKEMIAKGKNSLKNIINEKNAFSLLSGLISSDAHVRLTNEGKIRITFRTINEKIKDIFILCCKIVGIKTSVKIRANHGGIGKNPIFNIELNTNDYSVYEKLSLRDNHETIVKSRKKNNSNVKTFSNVGVKSIKPYQIKESYCITVEDNHNLLVGTNNTILAKNCGACGRDKAHSRRKTLTKSKQTKTTTTNSEKDKTIKTVVNSWAEVDMTIYPNDTGENLTDENKARLSEYFTPSSSFFKLHGNVEIELQGCYMSNATDLEDNFLTPWLTASNCKMYDCAEFPFVKNANESFFYHDKDVPFNYKKINNFPKI
ncbi:MAG: hypothetical protein LBM02_08245, partial [Lachnospiraceae bacterium]|nr:hypothetical protein [Lachnospiraceae bacterium]